MYKEITDEQVMKSKISIDLVDGIEILDKDIAPNPHPEAGVTYWEDDNCVSFIPLHQIKTYSIYFGED